MSNINIDLLRREECQPLTTEQMADIKSQFHPSNTANVNITPYHIYDTDEHVVGEWRQTVNGVKKKKPVYERTLIYNGSTKITVGNPSVVMSGITDVFLNDIKPTLDSIIEMKKTSYKISQGTVVVKYNFSLDLDSGRIQGIDDVNSKWLAISFMPDEGITLRYTKTSDEWQPL